MARSKKCLKCKYAKPILGSSKVKDWRGCWYCDYLTMNGGIRGVKGDDPDNCLLFDKRRGKK